MKQLLLLSGFCFLSMVSFSQMVSGGRNAVITPSAAETKTPQKNPADTITVHSTGKTARPVVRTEPARENQPVNREPEQAVSTSSARKQ